MNKVTDIIAIHEALAFEVTHAGGRVSLSVSTRAGIVRITGPIASWLSATRGSRDANGRAWPASSAHRSAPAIARVAREAKAKAPTPEEMRAERAQRRELARATAREWLAMPPESRPSQSAMARERGLTQGTLWAAIREEQRHG